MLVAIMAGNSDDKLSQKEWSDFVQNLDQIAKAYQNARHFFGGSPTHAKWQNVCFVIEIASGQYDHLVSDLKQTRGFYLQDSVCVLAGDAEFV